MAAFDRIPIDYAWRDVERDAGQPYKYPDTVSRFMEEKYSRPVVYRWAFYKSPDKPYAAYIGEAENLAKQRVPNYLRAHPSQKTNYRLKNEFESAIAAGQRFAYRFSSFRRLL